MKKLLLLLLTFTAGCILWAQPISATKVQEIILENGLTVFLLENPSDALVHIDYSVRAGFSAQTPKTNGFFKLFTRLIQQSLPQINFDSVQCNSDNSRFLITSTPSQTEQLFTLLAQTALNPQFSDELIASEFAKLKTEVQEESGSMGGFINSAIDSRIFSQTPWKHDSGIYPAIFSGTALKNARLILETLSEKWFTPQNSALFISGNIDFESVLLAVQKTFGKFYSASGLPEDETVLPVSKNSSRKYVIHNPEFSKDITQVVVQYPGLAIESADLLSAVLNNPDSTFKNRVLELKHLNIIGNEYIDVASAHKKGNSRLIFQTLMQNSIEKKSQTSSLEQVQDFVVQVKESTENISENEVQFSKHKLEQQLYHQLDNPVLFMEKLSDFWGMCGNLSYADDENLFGDAVSSVTAARMLWQIKKIDSIPYANLTKDLKTEPYVFVIINSQDYKQNRKEYAAAGYEEITVKNAGWYVQQMEQEIADLYKPKNKNIEKHYAGTDNGYYERNHAQIKKINLKNGIPVTIKKDESSHGFTLLLSVKGGKLQSANDNGFEEVMMNLLGTTIQREFYKYQQENPDFQIPEITVSTDLYTSSIVIQSFTPKLDEICNIVANAIIFGEILPAYADRAVSSRQYRKRLENGSAVNQLYGALIDALYENSDYASLYETKNDILENTKYTKIQQAYPQLLDAKRYELIFTGMIKDDLYLTETLEGSFGMLSPGNYSFNKDLPVYKLPKTKQLTVKINHTFLTDIPAEKAGPMPAVLIPTTEFQDPVIFFIKAPETPKQKDIFNAVLNYLPDILGKEISRNPKINDTKVYVQFPQYNMNFGLIIFQNVAYTREVDSLYKNILKNIHSQLKGMQSSSVLLQNVKSKWVLEQMSQTYTSNGMAKLIQKGSELFPEKPNPEYFLESYNNIQTATAKDFIDVMEYFPSQPAFKVYSAESKK